MNTTLIKGAVGTSQELRQRSEAPPVSPHPRPPTCRRESPLHQSYGQEQMKSSLVSRLRSGRTKGNVKRHQGADDPALLSHCCVLHTLLTHKCTAVRKGSGPTEPSASQVVRLSGSGRCHQFVPRHGGHAGDGEAMAAPCPHHS